MTNGAKRNADAKNQNASDVPRSEEIVKRHVRNVEEVFMCLIESIIFKKNLRLGSVLGYIV